MTQTEAPTQDPDGVAGHGAHGADDHHDPLHDIDDKKTVIAVIGSLIIIVVLIWVMAQLFNLMVQVEKHTKIGNIPATEFHEIKAKSDEELAGKNPNRGSKTIDQAIQEYINK